MKLAILFSLLLTAAHGYSQKGPQPLQPSGIFKLTSILDCKVSPEGEWIAYVVSKVDSIKDKSISHIWMCDWKGKANLQMTNGEEGDEAPDWSPDGKYLSFISSRNVDDKDDKSTLWVLDRRGGEGQKLLEVKGSLLDYAWRPDGKKIALVIKDPDYSDTSKTKIRKPYVMNRYRFKQDVVGYLENRRTHLYLFDLATKKIDTLTRGNFEEREPTWSPDGTQIAFVSNRTEDPDRNENDDIWVMNASPGSEIHQLTTWKGTDNNPVWSPDGKYIAYLQSTSDEPFTMYGQTMLALISPNGGVPKLLTKNLDRPVSTPRWSKDSKSIGVLVADNRVSYPASISVADGTMKKLATGEMSFSDIEGRIGNDWVTLMSTPQLPTEIYAIEGTEVRRITHMQDSFINSVTLAKVEGFQSNSIDGTKVSGILYLPPNVVDKNLPLILFIHGGPVGQDEYEFDMERQVLSCGGFAVAAVNYRGSNGRGLAYTRAIYADWGNKEVKDIIGAANYLIAKGIADSSKLGIAGWSYGGILTDYTIATDPRFKAASSGAGSALQLSMYGVDQYITQYNTELGKPWEHTDKWIQLSYPFFKANKIKTPTLFMASQKDFNVPSVGAEQMYQALRTLGIPTELIIYPGQYHGITVPSYKVDRLQRWLDWFGKYLKE